MMRWGMVALAVLAAGQGCGGSSPSTWKCAEEQAQFSRASISVDPNKRMADLTTDERTSVCAEFSRALTDSLETPEFLCKGASHDPAVQGTPACQSMYQQCLQAPPPPQQIPYCTSNMSGMWNCPITIGQYQTCFNDLNSTIFYALNIKQPVCAPADLGICGAVEYPPSCAAADCDYLWND